MGIELLHQMFSPSSVAVLGADDTPGRDILANLLSGGFEGRVYAIGEQEREVSGLPVRRDLDSIDGPVDLAVLALPSDQLAAAVRACGRAGIRTALIPTRDVGGQGNVLTAEAHDAGVRLIGPRSWGIVSPWGNVHAALGREMPLRGRLAVISQSAAICAAVLDLSSTKQIGLSHLIGLGDMLDIDCADVLDYLAMDSRVGAILVHLEWIANLRSFMSAARAASRVKPIVVLKTGHTRSDRSGAITPTGRLIRTDAAYDAAFERAGIVRVDTVADLFDCGDLLSKQPRPRGPNLAILSNVRSPGIMAVDALSGRDLHPAPLGSDTEAALEHILLSTWDRRNPILIRDVLPPDTYRHAVRACLDAWEIHGILIILAPTFLSDPVEVAKSIASAVSVRRKPVLAVWMGGRGLEAGRRVLDEAGIPTYDAPEAAVRALLYLEAYDRNLRLLQEIPRNTPKRLVVDRARAREIIHSALEKGASELSPRDSLGLLEAYDLPTTATFPRPEPAPQPPLPTAVPAPVVPPEAGPDLEFRLASRLVPSLGPVILFGYGGIGPEVLLDHAIGLPPLNRPLARRILEATRLYGSLGDPHRPPLACTPALEEFLSGFSRLVTDRAEIREMEIGSLRAVGQRVVAADARVLLAAPERPSPMHLIISTYPDEYETRSVTRAGLSISIRPIKPEDAPLLKELWASLSPQTLYLRFSSPAKALTPELLVRFTQIDYDRELALIAQQSGASGERMLGVARLIGQPGADRAEFAIVVGDPWQGLGVGAKLLGCLVAVARRRRMKRLWGLVLGQNRAMLELGRKLGWTLVADEDPSQVLLELDVSAVEDPEILDAFATARPAP